MRIRHLAVLACAALPAPVVAETIYFGENQSPGGGVSGAPVTARNSFLSNLSGVSTEDFESETVGDNAFPITFTGSAGTINGTLSGFGAIRNSNSFGTYATSGLQFYDNEFETFTLNFTTSIAAFGFYGTDIGDISEALEITLDLGLPSQRIFTVANTIGGNDGSLLFWGIIDTANPFTSVSFNQSDSDRFGFDDLTVGDARQVVNPGIPEPSTWAMLILGFGAVGASLRRRKQTARVSFA